MVWPLLKLSWYLFESPLTLCKFLTVVLSITDSLTAPFIQALDRIMLKLSDILLHEGLSRVFILSSPTIIMCKLWVAGRIEEVRNL